jgi:hypothetical protein
VIDDRRPALAPTVGPLREALLDINPDKFLEDAQDKITYTLDELNEIVGRLTANYRSFSDYVNHSRTYYGAASITLSQGRFIQLRQS